MARICIVTCYHDPDYIRARGLRATLQADPANKLVIIKNKHKGVLRYPEVLTKLLISRLLHPADVYILTFRGYELLPFFNLLTIGKKRIYDDMINLIEWVVYEHHKVRAGSVPARLLWWIYQQWLKPCDVIVTDTESHANYAAALMKLPREKFVTMPVSTDETVFTPQTYAVKGKKFQVFYCGNNRPLYGLQYLLDAALELRDKPNITFLISDGGGAHRREAEAAIAQGARITYTTWTPFLDLPKTAAASGLCVAGPFGNTLQGNMVITGKTYQFLAMGLPVLIGETKDTGVFKDGENCLLVPQADTKALVKKIVWAAAHRQELRAIGQQGHKTYVKHYSNMIVANSMKRLLRQLQGSSN